MNVIDSVPQEHRDIFVEVLQERDTALLEALRIQQAPTVDQAEEVAHIFGIEFMAKMGSDDDHPTELGVRIDDALGAFLKRWPQDILAQD